MPIVLPAAQVQQGPEWANLEANQQGFQSLLGGLASIQDAQKQNEERRQMALLAQVLQEPDPVKRQAGLVQLVSPQQPEQGMLGKVFNSVNPMGRYNGTTGMQAGIANALLGNALRPQEDIDAKKAYANYMNRYGTGSNGELSAEAIVKQNKQLEAAEKALTEPDGTPTKGNEQKVAAIRKKKAENASQIAEKGGVDFSSMVEPNPAEQPSKFSRVVNAVKNATPTIAKGAVGLNNSVGQMASNPDMIKQGASIAANWVKDRYNKIRQSLQGNPAVNGNVESAIGAGMYGAYGGVTPGTAQMMQSKQNATPSVPDEKGLTFDDYNYYAEQLIAGKKLDKETENELQIIMEKAPDRLPLAIKRLVEKGY